MARSIFSDRDRREIVDRFERLPRAATARWGRLSAAGMLCHCRKVNAAVEIGESSATPTFKQKALKTLVLHLMKKLPKGINSGSAYLPGETIVFEDERYDLIHSIESLAASPRSISGTHPVFGKMTRTEWGYFIWLHLDHHLRQFGG